MNLIFFELGGCAQKQADEIIYCKEIWNADAMPLIRIPAITERIFAYDEVLARNILSSFQFPINDSFGSRLEHQYLLDLNTVTDPAEKEEYKKVFALTSCKLYFHNAQALRNLNWNINEIFGQGRPDNEVGSIELKPIEGISKFWQNYYPGNSNLDLRLFYFNLDLAQMGSYLIPLIKNCVSQDYAEDIFYDKGKDINDYTEWENEYFNFFIEDPTVSIQVNGGDVIGVADNDVAGTNNNNFRLSVFFLEKDTNNDFSSNLENFMRFRGRIPTNYIKTTGGIVANYNSMSGHPVIFQYVNIPVAASRVDFMNHANFENKATSALALDNDIFPTALAFKKLPSNTQQVTLVAMGITSQEWETNEFTLFNPDGRILEITAANTDVNAGEIEITPSQISNTQTQQNIKIAAPNSVSTGTLEIFNYETGTDPVAIVNLVFFDCVIVPVKFWKLQLVLNEEIKVTATEADMNLVLQSGNRVLSNQCNLYFQRTDVQVPLEIINITTQSVPEINFFHDHQEYKYDKMNTDHYKEIQIQLKNKSAPEINIIWAWDLSNPLDARDQALGNTSQDIFDFPYPYILIKVSPEYTDEDRGRVLAHEFGHWIKQRNINDLSTQEKEHFDHDPNNKNGNDEYTFNLMKPVYDKINESLTIEQGRIINQYSPKVQGADPHL